MSKQKIIRTIVLVITGMLLLLAILAAALRDYSWTTQIDLELYGATVTLDGKVTKTGSIIVQGQAVDYLFQKENNTAALEVELPAAYAWRYQGYDTPAPRMEQPMKVSYLVVHAPLLRKSTAEFESGYLALSVKDGLLILKSLDDSAYLVGSADPDYDFASALDYFSKFVAAFD